MGWTEIQIQECLTYLQEIRDTLLELAPWVVVSAFASSMVAGILIFKAMIHGKERRQVW